MITKYVDHKCEVCRVTFLLDREQLAEPEVDRGVCPTCTRKRLRDRIAELKRERDEANASAVNAYTDACAARADAARLASEVNFLRTTYANACGMTHEQVSAIRSDLDRWESAARVAWSICTETAPDDCPGPDAVRAAVDKRDDECIKAEGDAARLAEALRVVRLLRKKESDAQDEIDRAVEGWTGVDVSTASFVNESDEQARIEAVQQECWSATAEIRRVLDAALAAHDAGTPAGGVWLTAEEVGLLVEWGNAAPFDDEADKGLLDKLRKARGGAR